MIDEVEKNLCAILLFEFLHAYDMSAASVNGSCLCENRTLVPDCLCH